eukprot:CAMPEP_0172665904 /NCGR_PEP_ID=MMETSP1074-20121228/7514_1 /TAXON_ID=2916 /ORGANISM="Ceratium fusus, Strain PA161109" /LENGTH=196 /DNA_ID=CAMNT_0013482255 /DNA_START=68 /DNA_END=658 /DNA_ORIENTATION=+
MTCLPCCCEGYDMIEVIGPSTPVVVTWQATVSKAQHGKLGVAIVPEDNTLRFERLDMQGAVADYNASNRGEAVKVGDFVTSVNGVTGFAPMMLEAATRHEDLQLTLARSRMFRATVKKSGSLGVTFGVFPKTLVVKEICSGPIEKWNSTNKHYVIQPGDLFIEVNGVKDNGTEILEALKADGDLRILIRPLGGAGY